MRTVCIDWCTPCDFVVTHRVDDIKNTLHHILGAGCFIYYVHGLGERGWAVFVKHCVPCPPCVRLDGG